jgi:hypothetical protein
MTEKGVVWGQTAARQIAKTVREVARRTTNEKPHRGRWQQQRGASSTIIPGIVRASLGCGYYEIELGEFTGSPDDIGSGSSGSGSGSGIPCDPCVNVVGEGTSACELEITAPASNVVGSGKFVTAYDTFSDKILLVVGTDCLVTKPGKSVAAGIGSSGSGSGSGSGSTEEIWQVVNGYREHIVQYKERWDCCEPDGPATLIAKTPIIMLGHECEEILCGECPGGSGSGSGS